MRGRERKPAMPSMVRRIIHVASSVPVPSCYTRITRQCFPPAHALPASPRPAPPRPAGLPPERAVCGRGQGGGGGGEQVGPRGPAPVDGGEDGGERAHAAAARRLGQRGMHQRHLRWVPSAVRRAGMSAHASCSCGIVAWVCAVRLVWRCGVQGEWPHAAMVTTVELTQRCALATARPTCRRATAPTCHAPSARHPGQPPNRPGYRIHLPIQVPTSSP